MKVNRVRQGYSLTIVYIRQVIWLAVGQWYNRRAAKRRLGHSHAVQTC